MAAVLGAVSVAVLSYLGFDAIASFAEEVTGGSEQVARAVLFCLALAGVLFVAQSYLAALLMPVSVGGAGGRSGAAGPGLLQRGGVLGRHLAARPGRGQQGDRGGLRGAGRAGGGRAAAVRDGPGTAAAARCSPGPRTGPRGPRCWWRPPITLVAAVWAARRDDGLDHLVSVVDVGALVAFTLLHASVVGWFVVRRRRGRRSWWRHLVVPVLGAAVTVAVIVEASGTAQLVGAVWLAVGLAVLFAQRGPGAAGSEAAARLTRRAGPCPARPAAAFRRLPGRHRSGLSAVSEPYARAWLSIRPPRRRCRSARCPGSSGAGSTGSARCGSRGRSPSCRGGRARGSCS